MNAQIMVFAIIAAAAVVLGGGVVVARSHWPKRVQEVLLSLSAGFVLALVFLKLIPASFEAIGERAAIWVLIGFGVVHFFEHTVVGHLHFGEETHHDVMVTRTAGISAFVGLFVHAFFDGLTISVGLQYDFFLGVLVFVAVLLHKFPEGLTVGSIMLTAGYPRKTVFYAAVGIGVATVLGASSTFLLENVGAELLGFAFAFSAGTMVYVGASDLIPEVNKTENRIPPMLVFVGMLLFYVSELILEGILPH